ncbi:MAG: ThuA domain-containing protein [Verrucomicrobia bacterium]|nr:ThuA domain-containing protein [Verrucomicrobiota bacterium]
MRNRPFLTAFTCACTLLSLTAAPAPAPHLVFMIGEDEYETWKTLPEFAKADLEPNGFWVTIIHADKDDKNNFAGLEDALAQADLLFVSVRRRSPHTSQLAAVRKHLMDGKPLIGIRTSSHAFATRGEALAPGRSLWPEFDPDVLGGHYRGHHGSGPNVVVKAAPGAEKDPILEGVDLEKLRGNGSLYQASPLVDSARPLLIGSIPGKPPEPIAWTHRFGPKAARIFYTSFGHPLDFQDGQFRRLLLNAIGWALNRPAQSDPQKTRANIESPDTRLARGNAVETTNVPQDAPIGSGPQSPEVSMKHFRVWDDLELDQVLAEPVIEQPVFLNFDERGRMWVVEYRQYPDPAGLKMVSRDSVWRAVYDKVPPPPPGQDRGLDRITIHEDTDGDGVFENHKTFLDGLNIVTSVERGRGGVWVLNPPYLLFYPDANNDDIPDADPVVHLSGFGLEDTHSVVNSLRWGPDGWLYGAQGSTVTAQIIRPNVDEPPVYSQGQGIWRYHPETKRYEFFAEGGGNTFGVEIDAQGRIFSGHNGGDTRGFHYVQGGYLRKGFEKHGPLSNPYAFGFFPEMSHHKVERFTHNFVIYDGGALPERYNGRLFGIEPIQGRIVLSEITPDQSTFKTKDRGHPVISGDRWFRPVDIKAGPDGAIYFCDWYDQQVNHYRNHEGKIDPRNGRIYRIKAKGSKPQKPADLGNSSTQQLVALLTHKNKWHRQTALRLFADRKDISIVPALARLIQESDGQAAIESLWALYLSGGLTEEIALNSLDHPDPFVRLWTVRLLSDEKTVSSRVAAKLIQLARTESHLETRSQLACSARRLPASECLSIVRNLLTWNEDNEDKRIPLLLWWAIESKADIDRKPILALLKDRTVWDLTIVKKQILEKLTRRYAQAGSRKDLLTCAELFDLSPSIEHSRILFAGFEEGFKGRTSNGLPEELSRALARHSLGSVGFGLRRGDKTSVSKALEVIGSSTAALTERLEYLAILSEVNLPESRPVLLEIARTPGPASIRKAALTALSQFSDLTIGESVVALYNQLDKETRTAAQTLLASRANWSTMFVEAVNSGMIPQDTVSLNTVRKIKLHKDPQLVALAEHAWGNTGTPTSAEMDQEIKRLAEVVRAGIGDPYKGRTLFGNSCAQCHTLFTQGGRIGPDLTAFKRDDLENMLLSIVNPSAEIREGYENYLVETKDDRSFAGFLAEKDNRVIVLRGLDGQNILLNRSELVEMKAAGMSLMPEALLSSMDEQDTRDLFAYLRSTQPLVGSAP